MRILLAALAIIAAAFIMWGIGSAIRRFAKAPTGRWAVSVGIGLATVICAGGILNLAHIAYRTMIWVVIVVAVGVAISEARRSRGPKREAVPRDSAARIEFALAAIVIAAAMLFAIATQLPPREFNYQDDLQKYFAHPVRMLETGTLHGSALSGLGSETLGGQAFLHGIVLSILPLPYINGVDAIFGLFALLLIASSAAWRRFGWFPGAALGALLIAIFNPLYANVSGLYTAAVLMATAVVLVADEREEPSPVLLGLVYAALVAIKPSFGLFAAFHLVFATLAGAAQSKNWRQALAWPARVIACSAACVAPWFAMYLPTYFSHGTFAARSALNAIDLADVNLFSTKRLFDGDSVIPYTVMAAVAVFVAVLAVIAWNRDRNSADDEQKPLGLFAGAAAGVACFLTLMFYLPLWTGFQVCVRYSVPFLMGSCAISALMAPSLAGKLPRLTCVTIPALVCIAIFALFAPAAPARYEQAINYGSILEFSKLATLPDYGPYIERSLSNETRENIQKLQKNVPVGEPLLAWIDTPYLLDYHRNQIVDLDMAGTATSWAHIPAGTHYYLWEYQGYAVWKQGDYLKRIPEPGIGARDRLIAKRSFDFANFLAALASRSEVIAQFNDGGDRYVLFRVPEAQPQ